MNSTPERSDGPRARREPAPFSDWWDELLWPKVLTAAGLGLRPNRLGLAFFGVVLAAALLGIGTWIDDAIMGETGRRGANDWIADLGASPAWSLFVALPLCLVRHWPVTTLVAGPVLVLVWTIIHGAIARMTAVEVALGKRTEWTHGLAYSVSRWGSLLGAVLSPAVLIWIVALLGALFGAVLLRWPVVNIAGGLLYGLVLIGGLVAALAAGAYLVGSPLLAPAVVCEGTDAIDAMQRVFAYVTARLPRLLLYLLLAAVGVAFIAGIVALLAYWTVDFAGRAAGAGAGEEGRSALAWAWGSPAFSLEGSKPEGSFKLASGLIGFWIVIPLTFAMATLLSCAAAASTMVYLAMRQACDGQDIAELWSPGAVEATMAETMAARSGSSPPPRAIETPPRDEQ